MVTSQVPLPEAVSVELPIIRSGVVDVLGVWYDLHLDHTHSISTSPLASTKWEQALFPIEGNLTVSSGRGIVPIQIGCTDTQLVVSKWQLLSHSPVLSPSLYM